MDLATCRAVVSELAEALTGGKWGRVWQLGRAALVCEIRPRVTGEMNLLFLCPEPSAPRLYLINRRVRELERQALPPQGFAMSLRRQLEGATVTALTADATDRIARLELRGRNELGEIFTRTLIVQLTGRTANLLLLNETGHIRDTLRPRRGDGQEIGQLYAPPAPARSTAPDDKSSTFASDSKPPAFVQGDFPTLSAAADAYYTQREADQKAAARLTAARQKVAQEIAQRTKLLLRLRQDLTRHGNAEEHKQVGDLLLANLATAQREGDKVTLIDYFADDAPALVVAVDENLTLPEAATRAFNRYGKAKRAAVALAHRITRLETELTELRARSAELSTLAASDAAAQFSETEKSDGNQPAASATTVPLPKSPAPTGTRRYLSSDGYEILVGRTSRDNDYLTWRVARPHDWWLHAADYPGSHVVIRNHTRGEIPQKTLHEAAQLAAQYSQAKNETKADVRYTQRKFLSKPKGAAPGLVRLSSFKTLIVTPAEAGQRV